VRLLRPLIEVLKAEIFASSKLHGEDTPIKVLAPGLGKTKTGRIWTYVRGDKTPPAVCYFYSPDRKGIRPAEHLKNFSGVLQADAYFRL
jgi:transposase